MRAFDRRYRHHKPRLHGGGAFTVGQPLRRYNTERTTRDAASPAGTSLHRSSPIGIEPEARGPKGTAPVIRSQLMPRASFQGSRCRWKLDAQQTRRAANSTRSKLDARQTRRAANSMRSKLDAQQTRCAASSMRSKLGAQQTRCAASSMRGKLGAVTAYGARTRGA
jgi:hypothetical protein